MVDVRRVLIMRVASRELSLRAGVEALLGGEVRRKRSGR